MMESVVGGVCTQSDRGHRPIVWQAPLFIL